MPLDGSGNYQLPPGTEGVPDTPVESLAYNTFLHDLRDHDLNIARPITRGGTGASDPTAALTNLGGEKGQQVVVDYDTMVWLSGSFYSDNTVGRHAPVDGHRFVGFSTVQDVVTQGNVSLIAIDLDSTPPGDQWTRTKKDGVWSTWSKPVADAAAAAKTYTDAQDALRVLKAGDTMSGNLTIARSGPIIVLNDNGASPAGAILAGARNGLLRWMGYLGAGGTESGGDAGSQFALTSFTDAGAPKDVVLTFDRANGLGVVKDGPVAPLGIATKKYVDDNTGAISQKLSKVADDVTAGNITIAKTNPALLLSKTASGQNALIAGQNAGLNRWIMELGNTEAETGGGTGIGGSSFALHAYNNAGTFINTMLRIARDSTAIFSGALNFKSATTGNKGTFAFGGSPAQLFFDMDGAGAWPLVWTNNLVAFSQATTGYHKFPSGLIIQWGIGSGGDQWINFPVGYPNYNANVQATVAAFDSGVTSVQACFVSNFSTGNFYIQPRYSASGGVLGASTANFHWFSVGW